MHDFEMAEQEFPCGYAPRSMQYSLRSDALFVGCKDGTVTIVPGLVGRNNPKLASYNLPAVRSDGERFSAVRALCEWCPGWLLIGRDDGSIHLVNWEAALGNRIPDFHTICAPSRKAEPDRIAYLEWLNQDWLLVSPRSSGAWAVRRGERPRGSVKKWAETAFQSARREVPELTGVVGSIPMANRRSLQILKNGEIWVIREDAAGFHTEKQPIVWPETPGFVSDFAFVKKPYKTAREKGRFEYRAEAASAVYVATDGGVFLLEETAQGGFESHRIALPGVGRMCLALTYFADQKKNRYLWVSDSAGDAHLFVAPAQGETNPRNWQRSGIRHDASQVHLGFASWRTLEGGFVVGQARRNDVVVISRYQRLPPGKHAVDMATAASDPQHLLRHGTAGELEQFMKTLDKDAGSWEIEAMLADFFEYLGEDFQRLTRLREFLRNPTSDLAMNVLQRLKTPEQSARAIELWTYALLGTVHRYKGHDAEKESLYLGIIRWLRAISESADGSEKGRQVKQAVEHRIMFTRKWGLFGGSYAKRRSAAVPWKVFEKQEQHDLLDRYSYQGLLFQRQIDLEHEERRGQKPGRTAWDLQTLDADGKLLVAVSWIWGGVELYQVSKDEKHAEGYRFDLCAAFTPTRENPDSPYRLKVLAPGKGTGEDLDHGHCRALVLGRLPKGGGHYLLAAPAQPPGEGRHNHFEIWRLDTSGSRVRVKEGFAAVEAPLTGRELTEESVYSLLEVESGLILAGLRGHRGIARILPIKLEGDPLRLRLLKPEILAAASPEGKSIARNTVWALAKEPSPPAAERHVVFAGCGDGQVWRLEIDAATARFKRRDKVDRLGAPVWALSCRVSTEDSTRRVFAGGADGTIVGWQQLPGSEPPRFVSVWATWEDNGPIARIHPLLHHENGKPFPMILAVTQQRRAILFADYAHTAANGADTKLHRRRVPGERLGRLVLDASPFASELIELPEELRGSEPDPPVARLMSATNDGRLQIHTIRYPFHLLERRAQYHNVVETWRKLVCGPANGDSRSYQKHRLRVAEVVYSASPAAPHVLVRGLLEHPDHSEPGSPWSEPPRLSGLHRQWIPRYLRPLFDLNEAWNRKDPDAGAVEGFLTLALERAWQQNDRELFVEIVTVVLIRTNHWLVGVVDKPERELRKVRDIYRALLDGVEKGLKRWLGSPEKAEIRARISFIKQLTDGDTLWHVGRRVDESKGSKAVKDILRERLQVLQRLLVTGDPLLSLETLRTANLALMRLCKRFVQDEKRAVKWIPLVPGTVPRQELPWKALEAYVQSLSDFAAGAFHATQRVNDSLAHEIARSFALALCCCPSSAIRIGHWMSEADLVSATSLDDPAEAVLDQCDLMKEIGIPVPEEAIAAFRWACRGEKLHLNDVRGVDNRMVYKTQLPFQGTLRWLDDLTGQLSSDAVNISLGKVTVHRSELEREGRKLKKADSYHHSRGFWLPALKELEGRMPAKLKLRTRHVRPDVVLFSRNLKSWCDEMIQELNAQLEQHRIFEPQHSSYVNVLRRLGKAAEEFPRSTAIQKNIVIGILSHGLLEALDEHVLELEEIAQALDPLLVWQRREEGGVASKIGKEASQAEVFAAQLLDRSREAESIPKNLRALQGLLESKEADDDVGSLRDLIRDIWGTSRIRSGRADITLEARTLRFLRLSLMELEQNQRNYGPSLPQGKKWPSVSIVKRGSGRVNVTFPLRLPLPTDDDDRRKWVEDNIGRLISLTGDRGPQEFMLRRETRDPASHGTGLYLANLAASVVGWHLRISGVSRKHGRFTVSIHKESQE